MTTPPSRHRPRAADGFWVFGYGSLMWRPGFDHLEMHPATLHGYHRAFCIYSWRYRGTRARPGLVLGLDRGGSCRGRAYRVADDKADAVRRYLDDREMEYEVYRQLMCRVGLDDGRRVAALCHVVNRSCHQYTGRLSEQRTVALIRQGRGIMGSCGEYLANTVRHLDEMGIGDGPLHRLEALVRVADRAGD
ncbi:MAG: gamma-glutamylcyclotransferase [Alphaproteobacteria bacterium]